MPVKAVSTAVPVTFVPATGTPANATSQRMSSSVGFLPHAWFPLYGEAKTDCEQVVARSTPVECIFVE